MRSCHGTKMAVASRGFVSNQSAVSKQRASRSVCKSLALAVYCIDSRDCQHCLVCSNGRVVLMVPSSQCKWCHYFSAVLMHTLWPRYIRFYASLTATAEFYYLCNRVTRRYGRLTLFDSRLNDSFSHLSVGYTSRDQLARPPYRHIVISVCLIHDPAGRSVGNTWVTVAYRSLYRNCKLHLSV